ncbi:MAG: hypothetical protein R3F38_03235 [Gammaproteobacteria bacterium]
MPIWLNICVAKESTSWPLSESTVITMTSAVVWLADLLQQRLQTCAGGGIQHAGIVLTQPVPADSPYTGFSNSRATSTTSRFRSMAAFQGHAGRQGRAARWQAQLRDNVPKTGGIACNLIPAGQPSLHAGAAQIRVSVLILIHLLQILFANGRRGVQGNEKDHGDKSTGHSARR